MSLSLGSTHVRTSAAGSFAPLAIEDCEKQHQRPNLPSVSSPNGEFLFLERLRRYVFRLKEGGGMTIEVINFRCSIIAFAQACHAASLSGAGVVVGCWHQALSLA